MSFIGWICLLMTWGILCEILSIFIDNIPDNNIPDNNIPESNKKEFDFVNIHDAVCYILQIENIRTRISLDKWCGGRDRQKLYSEVKQISEYAWSTSIEDPKLIVRRTYETILSGYTNSRVK